MPIKLWSLQGRAYPLHVNTKLNEKISEDGTLEFDIYENEYTYDAIISITKMWTVTEVAGPKDDRVYRIVLIDKSSTGEKLKVSVKARERQIDDLEMRQIYETFNGSMTANKFFDIVFKGTNYKYKLTHKVNAHRFENLGPGISKLEMFKKGLESYGLEYEYSEKSKMFTLSPSIQHKPKYFLDSKVNANNIKIEEDATKCYTYIKGYGDYTDQQGYSEAGLIVEYTHPLADVIGKREAKPVMNGNIKHEDTMKAYLETTIDASIKTSVSFDFVSLPEHFKEAVPNIGDVVKLRDDITSIDNEDVRIVEITTERDPYNKVVKQDVVVGDFRLRERYMKKLNNVANMVADINAASGLGGAGGLSGLTTTVANLNAQVQANQNATADVMDASNALNFNDTGITGQGSAGSTQITSDGIKYASDNTDFKVAVDGNGINPNAMPTATTSQNGAMSKEDKAKLNNLTQSSITLTGDDNKNYKLSVTNGNLNIQEVK